MLFRSSREKAETLLKNLHSRGVEEAVMVGEVTEEQDTLLVVKS